MKTDVQGCSTVKNAEVRYEFFLQGRKCYVQYDYRHPNGDLFSTVAEACGQEGLYIVTHRRNKWLTENSLNESFRVYKITKLNDWSDLIASIRPATINDIN